MSEKILVTGTTGFIGRNLIEELSKDYDTLNPSRKELDLFNPQDVKKYIEKYTPDMIVHCANFGGYRSKGNKKDAEKNIVEMNSKMFFNLVRAKKHETKMFYLGSGAEYDKSRELKKVSEDEFDNFPPENSYGYSKYIISKYIQLSENIVNLRLFGVFGKYEDYYSKFISNAIVKNINNIPIRINQDVKFDYLYIGDFVEILKKMFIQFPKEKILNVTPTDSVSLTEIARLINENSEYKTSIEVINDGMGKSYTGSNRRLLEEIGGYSFKNYGASIKELIDYYKCINHEIKIGKMQGDEFLKHCKK